MSKKIKIFLAIFLFYFFIIYVEFKVFIPNKKIPIIFYSNKLKDDLRYLFIKAIKKADTSIHIITYTLYDKKIFKEIKKKYKKNLKITIFYDKSKKNFLKNTCIKTKSKGIMHQKICVIDKKISFLGSANLTKSSLFMDNNLIVGIYNKKLAAFLSQEFPFKKRYFETLINNQKIQIFILPEKDKKALSYIKDSIKKSKKNIKIAMFVMTHPEIIYELAEAKKRGVDISLIIDKSLASISKKFLENNKIKFLTSNQIELLHNKYMLIDNNIFIFGSSNFTKSAFLKNDEIVIILEKLTKKQITFLNKLHNITTLETFKKDN